MQSILFYDKSIVSHSDKPLKMIQSSAVNPRLRFKWEPTQLIHEPVIVNSDSKPQINKTYWKQDLIKYFHYYMGIL